MHAYYAWACQGLRHTIPKFGSLDIEFAKCMLIDWFLHLYVMPRFNYMHVSYVTHLTTLSIAV